MKADNVYLAGIGTCIPERVTIDEAVERGWYDAALRESSGMVSVAVAGDTPAPDMAVSAARDALKRSGHGPDDIGALIHTPVFHQGPDIWSAPHYILRHTVDRPVPALELRQGCLGMVTSLRFAADLLTAEPDSTAVLVTAGDNFSTPNVDRWSVSDNYVLGDGGSAVVVSKRGGFARLLSVGSVSVPEAELLHRGGDPLFPPSATLGKPLDLDARVDHLRRQWAQGVVPPLFHLGDIVNEAVDAVLAEAGLTMDDITRVAHSAVARDQVTNGFLDPLGIDEARGTWEVNRRTGHCGGTDQIVGLDHLLSTGGLHPGDHVLLLAAAVGMEVGAAVLEITDIP
ncbi:ketoacyl-ACP synthase III family protein [Streptomyces sp. AK04-3B]|uniref:ketoacyl-ACP synthase III family protein n=1 Tax=Streptomyces sp. AK04-3B TaxID=3028650 RepID=UPI0029B012D9|nr:ketoacyl-ACP synthase III family protein [Streptomyces sp. AK04-3B]MDX3804312.1 ketoacyl-ACP synthase III family protein [Streptomyces sp. AK04-3B]